MRVEGRIAVVTGGASGIGRSLCVGLASHGAAGVVVADVDAGGAARVAEEVTASGAQAMAVTTEVANEADVRAMVARAEDAFGRIDRRRADDRERWLRGMRRLAARLTRGQQE